VGYWFWVLNPRAGELKEEEENTEKLPMMIRRSRGSIHSAREQSTEADIGRGARRPFAPRPGAL
jgi:hypothetical protein